MKADAEAEAPCRAAYPHVREDLAAILQSLREKPARIQASHPVTGAPAELLLSEPAFTDGLRVMLYSAGQQVSTCAGQPRLRHLERCA